MDRVLGTEDLVSAQGRLQQPGVQGNRGDPLAQFLRDEPARRLTFVMCRSGVDRRQERVERGCLGAVPLPELSRLIRPRINRAFSLLHNMLKGTHRRLGQNRIKLGECVKRGLLLCPARDEHLEPAGRTLGLAD